VNTVHPTKNLDLNGDDGIQNKDGIMRFTKKKSRKLNKSRNGGDKETSVIEDNISIPISSYHNLAESRPPAQRNSNTYNFKDHFNLECCNLTERYYCFPLCFSTFYFNWMVCFLATKPNVEHIHFKESVLTRIIIWLYHQVCVLWPSCFKIIGML
jgi:hypothetical protein